MCWSLQMKTTKIMLTIMFTCGLAAPHRTMGELVIPRTGQRTYIRPGLGNQSLNQRLEAAQQLSNRCVTSSSSCVLDQPARLATLCWAETPTGRCRVVVRWPGRPDLFCGERRGGNV